MALTLSATVQFVFAFVLVEADTPLIGIATYSFQNGALTGWLASCWLWRIYPGAVIYYEKGVSFGFSDLLTWDQIELRDSTVYKGRVVIVTQAEPKDTFVIQVSDELRDELMTLGRL